MPIGVYVRHRKTIPPIMRGADNPSFVHGMSHSREYRIWTNIKTRCNNPKVKSYKDYGARGILMCEEWSSSFAEFYRSMGPCPDGMTIERLDSNKGYQPGNCKWASWIEQQNNRTNNILITRDGETKTIRQWSGQLGIPFGRIANRLRLGFTTEVVLAIGDLRAGRACKRTA